MVQIRTGRRTFRQTTGAVGAVALLALGAAPAVADDATPEFAFGAFDPIKGVKTGSTFEVPATFTSTGTEPLDKVFLSYEVTRGLSHTDLPSNCLRYEVPSYDEAPSKSQAVCEFDQTVKPGVVYAPEKALTLKATSHALEDRLRMVVEAEDAGPDENASEPVRGTAPAVKLVERPDQTPATDGEEYGVVDTTVSTENTADFQVTGAQLTGKVGDTVHLKVAFTNAGPAWVLGNRDTSAADVRVKLPAGTTVTKADGFCDKLATGSYSCGTSQSWVDEGHGETYDFTVRIDKKVAGAKGSVAFAGPDRPFDKVASNDTAAIGLDVTGSGASPAPSASPTSSAAPTPSAASTASASPTGGSDASATTGGGSSTTGGSGATTLTGDLASTGSGSVLPLAGAAVAVVGLGAGTVLLARRRAAQK
ncbi:hypothetical protein [Streptomyces sp. NPDC087294]|uniref:hypothetical protein n=1 Tax=Streptomyces sp. NPDC087294 TaxID=3365777 RepID=UPI00380CEF07